jgi:Dolichyl-phosphate-mannose-protein mannosyltransferase
VIVLGAGLVALWVAGVALARLGDASDGSRATRAVRAMLGSFAILVGVEAALGACGRLDATSTLLGLCGVAVAITLWTRRHPDRRSEIARTAEPARTAEAAPREAWSIADVALACAIVAAFALRLQAGLHKTVFLYDALSYHLHAPVTWLHDRRLEIVPAVFGDPAPAYAPSNVELWFLFLMAPLRSDYLAGAGQLPFAALAVLAIAATVREAGGRRVAALGAGLAFLLVPEIWQQAPTAMTDLAMAALLLASLPFVVRLSKAPSTRDGLACAAALGLALGTKYVCAVLVVPFAALAAIAAAREHRRRRRRPHPRDVVAVGAIGLGTGGFWYARNVIVAGNPFYPVSGLGLPGLYDRAAMRAWDYHLSVADLGALGVMLAAGGIGFSVAAALGLLRARPPIELALWAAVSALFWVAVPYQESRFLFAAFGVAAMAVGRATSRPPAWLGWGALGVAIGGELLEFPTPERLALIPAGLLGAVLALVWRRIPAPAGRPAARAGALGLAVTGAFAIAVGLGHYRARDPGYVIGDDIDRAWSWFGANVHDARVAYTGTNVAFPLTGRDLGNRVTYVNVAGEPGERLHDFGRPRASATGLPTTPEPTPYRDGAQFETWLRNLRVARTELLFVAAMDPIVKRNVAADEDGFPVERAWADAHPALFSPRYASPAARIYAVRPP